MKYQYIKIIQHEANIETIYIICEISENIRENQPDNKVCLTTFNKLLLVFVKYGWEK